MERVSRQSSFLMKDYYKCIHPTDAETLPSKIPNWLLMIHTHLCWRVAEGEGWCKNQERVHRNLRSFSWDRNCPSRALVKCRRVLLLVRGLGRLDLSEKGVKLEAWGSKCSLVPHLEVSWLFGFLEWKDLLCHPLHRHWFIDAWFVTEPGNATGWGRGEVLMALVEEGEWTFGKMHLSTLSPGIRATQWPKPLRSKPASCQPSLSLRSERQGPVITILYSVSHFSWQLGP